MKEKDIIIIDRRIKGVCFNEPEIYMGKEDEEPNSSGGFFNIKSVARMAL